MDNNDTSNLFGFRMWDGILYFFFYIVLPVVITAISLFAVPIDFASGVYCYLTILISAFNNIYDGAGRRIADVKCRRNAKVCIIWLCDGIVLVYCIVVVFLALMAKTVYRLDWILLSYLGPVCIGLWDLLMIVSKDVEFIKSEG